MLYVIHNEAGEITQANKVFADPAGYDDRLRDLGHTFIKKNISSLLSPDHWHARGKRLRERPVMFIIVDKTTIKAGGVDSAVLRGCPIGGTYQVSTSGITVHSGLLDESEMEIFIPVPCIYRVTIDKWPLKTFTADIEAIL
jgi:hypothetical protein